MTHQSAIMQVCRPDVWRASERALLEKMLSEFLYEEILVPESVASHKPNAETRQYRLKLSTEVGYEFEAKVRLFDSYRVVPDSIRRCEHGRWDEAFDPLQFILDISDTVGLNATTAGHFLKEISHTLLADAHIRARRQRARVHLTDLSYAEIEGQMDGHPWIVFNKGRLGFDYDDYVAYAPEQRQPTALSWLAVRSTHATYQAVTGLDHHTLLHAELGADRMEVFRERLAAQGQDAEGYYWLPVHDWQWTNVIVPLFAGEIARQAIVPLGPAPDLYLPQQSIRTFMNISDPLKHHVKLPMSILNTLVYRGLPGERTVIAPRVTAWIHSIRDQDPFLRDECRVILLGEVASVNVDHPHYARLAGAPYQYAEMLGCIWRESISAQVEAGEHPVTLASLLHVDGTGRPFIAELVEGSGLSLEDWLQRLFAVMLSPLLHYLYQYGIVFSPHGENAILVLKHGAPHRLAMKDFVDDANISRYPLDELATLPADLQRVLRSEPPEGLCQFIWTSLFICHYRYLSDLLESRFGYSETAFWRGVAAAIRRYQERYPERKERYRIFDLFAPRFPKLCLNRNRLFQYGYADDGERPHAVQFGYVTNALEQVGRRESAAAPVP